MMKDLIVNLLGVYTPIDGCPDWSYIIAGALLLILVYSFFRIIGMVFK